VEPADTVRHRKICWSINMREPSEKATKRWVLALASVASFMVALDALVVTTALSAIRLDLGASIEALEWTVNAYNLCFAVLLLTGAALGDRLGRRRMFAVGLGLFVAASAACALAGVRRASRSGSVSVTTTHALFASKVQRKVSNQLIDFAAAESSWVGRHCCNSLATQRCSF
jgi:predicted MFS family arabinose efflux permease